MNAENFSELLNELPDEMIDAAMKKKTRLHIPYTRILMPAAAACILAAVCTGFYLMKDGKPERTLTEQSREAEITEVTDTGRQTGFDVFQAETTCTSASGTTGTDTAGTSASGTSASAGTQTSQTTQTARTAKTTVLPVSVRTQTDIPGTAASSGTASLPTETTETTAPSVYREALGNYTLPKPLADIIAEEIGTDAFCYYMDGDAPVNYMDRRIETEITILTKDRAYFVSCSATATDYLTLMMPDVASCCFGCMAPADISGKFEGEQVSMDMGSGKHMYTFVYPEREEGTAEEIAAIRARAARWAWNLVSELKEIPDNRIQISAFHTEEGMFSLPYVPEKFEPVYVVRDMDAQKISSATYTDEGITQELSAEQIEEMVNWWNQLGDLISPKIPTVDISSHKEDNRYLTITFNEPFSFYKNAKARRLNSLKSDIISMIIAERNDGTRLIRLKYEEKARDSFIVEEGLSEIYHPD